MNEPRENPEKVSQDNTNPVQPQQHQIKLDTITTSLPPGTLMRTIPAGQPTRFIVAPVQSQGLISASTSIQAQVVQAKGTSVPIRAQFQTVTTPGFHVPRGAAAVANIALPRASTVATPILRASPPTLQAIGVAPPQTIASAVSTTSIVGRNVVGVTPWVTTCIPGQGSQKSNVPQLRSPPITGTKIIGSQIRPIDAQARPLLLQSTTTKQVTLTQQTQVQVSGEKTVLKSYSGASQSTRMVTPAPNLSRITASLPSMVSIHSTAVLVPNTASIPIKTATGGKVLSHGSQAIQFTPVSSVQTIERQAIQLKPSQVGSVQPLERTDRSSAIQFTPVSSFSTNVQSLDRTSAIQFTPVSAVQSMERGSTVQFTPVQSIATTVPSLAATVVRPGGLVTVMLTNPSNTIGNPNPLRQPLIKTFQHERPPSPQNHPIKAIQNPVTIIREQKKEEGNHPKPSTTEIKQFQQFIPTEGLNLSTSSELNTATLVSAISHNLASKVNTSPRPSILRKRDPDNSPMRAQKNLTPVLTSLSLQAGSPPGPPGSPKRPESGQSGQSSTGSTTISANSSPGESPTIKSEMVDDETKPDIQLLANQNQSSEVSPRKKPRKQQLAGNQITEPSYSDDEMEFLSEDKIKKENRTESIDEDERVIPRKHVSLLDNYRQSWKVRNNHFMRYTDVRSKDERKPTLNELANQKNVLHKLEGWKVYHLGTQFEDMVNSETEYSGLYTDLLNVLENRQKSCTNKEFEKDLHRVSERIKANHQRSKVVRDSMNEARSQILKIFKHKAYVTDIINRNITKKQSRKRERL